MEAWRSGWSGLKLGIAGPAPLYLDRCWLSLKHCTEQIAPEKQTMYAQVLVDSMNLLQSRLFNHFLMCMLSELYFVPCSCSKDITATVSCEKYAWGHISDYRSKEAAEALCSFKLQNPTSSSSSIMTDYGTDQVNVCKPLSDWKPIFSLNFSGTD